MKMRKKKRRKMNSKMELILMRFKELRLLNKKLIYNSLLFNSKAIHLLLGEEELNIKSYSLVKIHQQLKVMFP